MRFFPVMKPILFALCAVVSFHGLLFAVEPLSGEEKAVLDVITSSQLRGHVSFLASDALEGRDTPSRGLDVAAEYIAATFRRLGLQPVSGTSYFQDGYFYKLKKQPMDQFSCVIDAGEKGKFTLNAEKARVADGRMLELNSVDAVKLSLQSAETPMPPAEALAGKAVLVEFASGGFSAWAAARRKEIQDARPAVLIEHTGFLRTPSQRLPNDNPPTVRTNDQEYQKFFESLAGPAKVSLKLQAPEEARVTLRNVAGVLPGSDPKLAGTYLLLTAHYDHVGVNERAQGEDKIFNGANDNASGTATMLALAEAFSKTSMRPKRSIVFMAYAGEEIGLFGSRYYAMQPLFPLKQTVANLNFEQMGRTDDNEGKRERQVTASGIDYTTLGQTLSETAGLVGVKTWKHDQYSDAFFSRSDNQALADAGIPAITLAVAWQYPDYHRAGDHWDKLDYDNFESVARAVGLASWRVANSTEPVMWLPDNGKNERYRKAWQALQDK